MAALVEKGAMEKDKPYDSPSSSSGHGHDEFVDEAVGGNANKLQRNLKGRHMQMIAIGRGKAEHCMILADASRRLDWCWSFHRFWCSLEPRWPWQCGMWHSAIPKQAQCTDSHQLLGFIIVGFMLLFTVQALGELAVLYPVNGAFFTYTCRFVDESW